MDLNEKLQNIKEEIIANETTVTNAKLRILELKKQGRAYTKLIEKAKELEGTNKN